MWGLYKGHAKTWQKKKLDSVSPNAPKNINIVRELIAFNFYFPKKQNALFLCSLELVEMSMIPETIFLISRKVDEDMFGNYSSESQNIKNEHVARNSLRFVLSF